MSEEKESVLNEELNNTEDKEESTTEESESIDTEETESEETEQSISDEELDSMTDEEFNAYADNGTIPERFNKTTSSDTTSTEEVKPEESNTSEDSQDTSTNEEESKEVDKDNKNEINYKEVYEKLFSKPIKADGTEIEIKNADELISLAQKGVNFTRKSQELASKRKIIKSLEDAHIKEKDLNILIDIHNGNKDAIKDLIKRNNIDIDYLSENDEDENGNVINKYTPNNNIVSDSELNFSDIVTDISKSPYKDKINSIVNNIWDKESYDLIIKDPKLLAGLYGEVSSGRFDKIQSRVVRDKLFNNSNDNTADIIRYMKFANEYEQEQNNKQEQPKQNKAQVKKKVIAGNKKSASVQHNVIQSTQKGELTDADIDKMSDEEFLKYYMR